MQPTPLNRRRFLELTTLGIGGLGLLYQSNSALAAQALPEERADKTVPVIDMSHCKLPTIPTRIFASSNTGVDDSRNTLGLQRLTCAGFDIQNPEVTRRQYLRFGVPTNSGPVIYKMWPLEQLRSLSYCLQPEADMVLCDFWNLLTGKV